MREEEKKRISLRMKTFFKKRWVFPSLYLVIAALLIAGIVWYQTTEDNNATKDQGQQQSADNSSREPSVEVNTALETVKLPLENPDKAVIKQKFYDKNASQKEQEAALVVYNNTYYPNTGIDIGVKDGKSFDVTAALSGKVTNIQEDALLGNVIEIEHEKGIVTQYQSVKDIQVKEGENVKQGQVIGKAGNSVFNEKAGVHVHFEIRKNNTPLNPEQYLNKTVQ
ncbi:M23 family metallopeptidase [Bacillus sp. FSL W8-0102]|uniref:M23 family metallopeptidase n=1 Tax=Bacillus sp. FSL W8-0102 TaxID=2978205 RepID=UPI0030F8764F